MNFGQDTPFGEATYPARTKHRLHKEHRKLCGLGGHRKTGHTWSLQNRPYGPGLRCCTLPFAFLTSLISEISKWRAISSSKLEKSLLQGRGGIFSKSPIVWAVPFRLVFDAMLIPLATWSSNFADRI